MPAFRPSEHQQPKRNPAPDSTNISYSSLKDAYLRKSFDAMDARLRTPKRVEGGSEAGSPGVAEQPPLETHDLVKHVLEFRPETTCQVPHNSNPNNPNNSASPPWGCYVRYVPQKNC
jgi:hypothetical protein